MYITKCRIWTWESLKRLELIFYLQTPLRFVIWKSFSLFLFSGLEKSYAVFIYFYLVLTLLIFDSFVGIFQVRLSLTFIITFINFNKSFDLLKQEFLNLTSFYIYYCYSAFNCSFAIFDWFSLDIVFPLFVNAQSKEGFRTNRNIFEFYITFL